jgi:hypothetical protein
MKNDVGLPIRLAILHACIFCLLIFIDYGFVYIDAHFGADDLAENSFTEWAAVNPADGHDLFAHLYDKIEQRWPIIS